MLLLPTLLLYALGLLLTGIGSRLASRCATWCEALCGLPMWMVGGTLVAVCTALPQLVLAFLAAGMFRYCAGRWYGSGGRCHPAGAGTGALPAAL